MERRIGPPVSVDAELIASDDLREAVAGGVAFLSARQRSSGELPTYVGRDLTGPAPRDFDSSPFATSLIVSSLEGVGSPTANGVIERALRFLRAEMEPLGVWRYWTSEHPQRRVIPADVDDTACASDVLRRHGVAFPDNRELLLANRDRHGRFHTWFVPHWRRPARHAAFWRVAARRARVPVHARMFWRHTESAPDDVDCIVNANALHYLGDGPAAPRVVDYLVGAFDRRQEACCDKWHLNAFTFYWATSRCAHAGIGGLEVMRDEMIARIVAAAQDDGSIGANALETALAVCALHNWHSRPPELDRALRFLLGARLPHGGWPIAVLYHGGPERYYGWGSEELTTGFCVEALARAMPA